MSGFGNVEMWRCGNACLRLKFAKWFTLCINYWNKDSATAILSVLPTSTHLSPV